MKTLKYIIGVLAMSIVVGTQAQNDLDEWLLKDCGAEEGTSDAQQIASYTSKNIKENLTKALENGPSAKQVREVRIAAGKRYDGNMKLIASGKANFLNDHQIEKVTSVTREEFVEDEEAHFVKKYKEQAKIGLDLVDKLGIDYNITMETYPSPANDVVEFSFVLPENSDFYVELFDVSGRSMGQIYSGNAQKGKRAQFTYNTSALTEGVYLYKVVANNRVFVEKLVIKH